MAPAITKCTQLLRVHASSCSMPAHVMSVSRHVLRLHHGTSTNGKMLGVVIIWADAASAVLHRSQLATRRSRFAARAPAAAGTGCAGRPARRAAPPRAAAAPPPGSAPPPPPTRPATTRCSQLTKAPRGPLAYSRASDTVWFRRQRRPAQHPAEVRASAAAERHRCRSRIKFQVGSFLS